MSHQPTELGVLLFIDLLSAIVVILLFIHWSKSLSLRLYFGQNAKYRFQAEISLQILLNTHSLGLDL